MAKTKSNTDGEAESTQAGESKNYTYTGAVSNVLEIAGKEVKLFAGAEIELPANNPDVMVMLGKGLLKETEQKTPGITEK